MMKGKQRDIHERWLHGEQVEGLAFLHNTIVEFMHPDGKRKEGWVVAATIRPNQTTYTVEACDGSGDFELPESDLRKSD